MGRRQDEGLRHHRGGADHRQGVNLRHRQDGTGLHLAWKARCHRPRAARGRRRLRQGALRLLRDVRDHRDESLRHRGGVNWDDWA